MVRRNNVEYNVIRDDYLSDLIEKVNDMLALGWRPQGGIFAYNTLGNGYKHCQAMIREK